MREQSMTDGITKQDKTREKKTRRKNHDLGKLASALHETKLAIADAADIETDEVNFDAITPSIAKSTADIASAIGVPADKLRLTVSLVA